jgi:hypothetical protein
MLVICERFTDSNMASPHGDDPRSLVLETSVLPT